MIRRWLRLICGMVLLAQLAHAQSEVRIGVLGLFHARELILEPAARQAVLVSETGRVLLLNGEPNRRRLVFHADGDQVVADGRSAKVWRATARDGAAVRFQLGVPGKIRRVYQGRLEVRAHHGELLAVVTMARELAVASIVASELPRDAPVEALKAQAVATRSFLAAGSRHRDFDFCDTTHCQFLRSPDDIDPRLRAAVKATEGSILSYLGKPIAAMYSSRCGGRTRSLGELGMPSGSGYPYYGVSCRWCREHPVRWQSRVDRGSGTPAPNNESDRILHARQWGWSALPGNAFTVKEDPSDLVIEGHSVGHGLGLCQFGAMGMAAAGSDFRAILAYYFPNSQIQQLPELE
jgi:hypothetical protein